MTARRKPKRLPPGPKPRPDSRTVPCQTRLSVAEHEAVAGAANRAGQTVSEWVRGAVVRAAQKTEASPAG